MLGWEVIPRIPLGNLSVSPHGVGIAVGYFLGATLMARRARKSGFDEDHAWNAAVVGILGAIVGARLAYVIGHSNQFNEPIEYLQIYKGGISLMGGLIGGFLAAWLYCRAKKLDFGRLADMGAAGLAIGTAVGRIGDLVIGDHLGRTTEGFWGWEYQGGELISAPPCDPSVYPSANGCIEPGMVVHQTALYDSLWALVIFLVILRLERKPRPKGFLVFTWAAMYSVGRILTDLTRVDKTWFGTGLTGSQLTAIAVLLVSLIGLARLRRSPKVPAVTPDDEGEAVVDAPAAETAAVETVPAGTEPALEPVEAPAVPVEQAPEPAVEPVELVDDAEPVETVVVVETVEEPPAAPDGEPLVPVEPVSPVAPEAVEPGQSPQPETVAVEPEAGAEPVEVLFAEEVAAPETLVPEEPPAEPQAGAEPVEVLFAEEEPPADPVEPPAEPVESLRETVAAVDAAEAVVVEASAPVEAAEPAGSETLLAEEPVGAEAIDVMPLPETSEPEFDSPLAADAEPSGIVAAVPPPGPEETEVEASPAEPGPSSEEEAPPAEPAEGRQEP
ncbi:MAG TPA: prolipoprotein diacylglyceryl transferase family protein [Actinomycetota bacterium]|nr:prolipoprotein diacylglyceryl transferase family protein [Actinomycetota bacterium]